jgi:hypothetical protein
LQAQILLDNVDGWEIDLFVELQTGASLIDFLDKWLFFQQGMQALAYKSLILDEKYSDLVHDMNIPCECIQWCLVFLTIIDDGKNAMGNNVLMIINPSELLIRPGYCDNPVCGTWVGFYGAERSLI